MKNLILTIVAVFCISSVYAQEKKKEEVKKKVKNKSEQRADQKIDKAIDDGLDAVENLFKFGKKKKKKKNTEEKEPISESNSTDNQDSKDAMNMLSSMFGSNNVEVEESYNFNSNMLIEMTSIEGKKKETNTYTIRYYLSDDKNQSAYEMQDFEDYEGGIKMIMDWDNKSMLMFMEEQKQIMSMPLNTEQIEKSVNKEIEKSDNENFDLQNFKKTGNTKEINGYTCEEYTFENDETKGIMWVTEEAEIDLTKMMGGLGSATKGKTKYNIPDNYPTGTVMEGTWTDKKSGDITKWQTKELNINSNSSISTKEYQVMNFGNMLNPGQKE